MVGEGIWSPEMFGGGRVMVERVDGGVGGVGEESFEASVVDGRVVRAMAAAWRRSLVRWVGRILAVCRFGLLVLGYGACGVVYARESYRFYLGRFDVGPSLCGCVFPGCVALVLLRSVSPCRLSSRLDALISSSSSSSGI
ncbi:hypothetical protein QBC47DRAFT_377440 [Echria macrotheca]|uniref:Transmembrane protein n=1 Tax=Echria macrotheca TaxID=438768 RepID=A0AAJ0F7D2_9PEZI|nr:hypothetical protein QBC47DRAFT_377440 [Echria macrotheca]